MKKCMKILKSQIKNLVLFGVILISSFIFFNSDVKAVSSRWYGIGFEYNYLQNLLNSQVYQDGIQELLNIFNNQNEYSKYVIFNFPQNHNHLTIFMSNNDATIYSMYDDDYERAIGLIFNGGCMSYSIDYDFNSNGVYRVNQNVSSVGYNSYVRLFNLGYSAYSPKYNQDLNYLANNASDTAFRRYFIIPIKSNYDLKFVARYNMPNSFANIRWLNSSDNTLTIGDTLPMLYNVSYVEPEITYSETSNNEIIDEETYTISKDISLTYTVDDSEINDYLYIYSLDEGNSWTTITPVNGVIHDTFRLKENKHIIARILNKNTLEPVYTFNQNVIGISQPQTIRMVYYIDNSVLNNGQDELYSLNVINNNSSRDIQFKLRISALDQTVEHMPRLIRAKGLIYNSSSNSYIENSNAYFDDLTCTKESFSSTTMECNGYLRSNFNGSTRYEFYFDNVDNVLIEYYDNASNEDRIVNYTDSFLKDYDKYYFNMNSDKAYINVDNINQQNKSGSIIIPYYFFNNDDLKVELLDYDYVNNNIIKKYNFLPTTDEYYRKFDFNVTDNSLPVLTNKKGKYCVTYYPNDNDTYRLLNKFPRDFFSFTVENTLSFGVLGLKAFLLTNTNVECLEEEQVYFYVSKDFKVTFNEIGNTSSLNIVDNNFNVITSIDDDFNNSNTYIVDSNGFFDSVSNAINYFTEPIREILKMIGYIWNSLNIVLKMFIIFIFLFIVGLFALRFLL